MKMFKNKIFRSVLAILFILGVTPIEPFLPMTQSLHAQGGAGFDYKAHEYVVTDFGTWKVYSNPNTSIAAGSATLTFDPSTLPVNIQGWGTLNPFIVGEKLTVDYGTTVQETVAVTAASCTDPTLCSITAVFANAHVGRFVVQTGTFGLQEAILWANSGPGGMVTIPGSWGGTTATITATTGSSTVIIHDVRSGANGYYTSQAGFYAASSSNSSSGITFNTALNVAGATPTITETVTAGELVSFKGVATTVAAASASTIVCTNCIPAGSAVVGVTATVITGFGTSNGLTSMKIGDGSTDNKFSSSTMAIVAGTTSGTSNFQSTTSVPFYASATSVVITANGGNFNTVGSIRITVFYFKTTP